MSAWVRRKIKEKVLVWLAKYARHGGRSALDFGAGVLVGGQQQSKRKQDNGKLPILAPLARLIPGSRVCV